MTNDYVAIKKIDVSSLNNDEIYNISREALYMESFKHKNIIKFHNSYMYENGLLTVMQFAKGGELTSYLSEKKILSELEAKFLFKQIHAAVKYIHNKNVIHRDLKPNNILFLDEEKKNLAVIINLKYIFNI
jgi:serine/threonine protein kinase